MHMKVADYHTKTIKTRSFAIVHQNPHHVLQFNKVYGFDKMWNLEIRPHNIYSIVGWIKKNHILPFSAGRNWSMSELKWLFNKPVLKFGHGWLIASSSFIIVMQSPHANAGSPELYW